MLLGSKPLSEMTDTELYSAIAELRQAREELRTNAVRKKKEQKTVTELSNATTTVLAFLRGEIDELK